MDWIEFGCFDALKRKYLKQIVLGVYLDKDRPLELHESYTFDVDYRGENGGMGLKLTREGEKVAEVAASDVKKSIAMLLRKLIVLVQSLDVSMNIKTWLCL
jgi:hypothetical protein